MKVEPKNFWQGRYCDQLLTSWIVDQTQIALKQAHGYAASTITMNEYTRAVCLYYGVVWIFPLCLQVVRIVLSPVFIVSVNIALYKNALSIFHEDGDLLRASTEDFNQKCKKISRINVCNCRDCSLVYRM